MIPQRASYLKFWPLCQVTYLYPIFFLRSPAYLHLFMCYFENSALLGAFVLGTYLGWASPVMPQMKIAANNNNLTTAKSSNGAVNELLDEKQERNIWHLLLDEDQMSWVGSLINVGAVVGCLCGGFLMDKFGRKVILAVVFMLYTIGYLLITLAVDPSELLFLYFLLHNTLHDLQTPYEPNIRIVTRMIVPPKKGIITRLNCCTRKKKKINRKKHFNIKNVHVYGPGMLYIGRIVGGLAGGMCCVVAPSYIGIYRLYIQCAVVIIIIIII